MKTLKLFGFFFVALVLSGCASTQKLSDEDRARTKTVVVNTNVQKGQLFLLAPSGANIGMMFGAVGGLAVSGAIENNQVAFGQFLDRNAVSIQAIVYDEFQKVLRESGRIVIEPNTNAEVPVINVSVPQYGFGVTHVFSSNVVPVLQISCEMKDPGGKVLWAGTERMLPSIASPMETTTWTALHDSPKSIETEWRKAARYLAQKVVKTL